MEEPVFTRAEGCEILWEIASRDPEETRGILRNQVRACKDLYILYGYQPSLQRLNEIANMAASRTKGNLRGQQSAARVLKKFVSSVKVDKNKGIQ